MDAPSRAPSPEPQVVCGLTGDDYAQVLADLLPPGLAWPRDLNSVQQRTMRGLAEELARLNARNCDLLAEAYPCGSTEALPDWERVAGLPDPCIGELPTLQQRRGAVCAKLASRGGASEQFFIDLAASYGYEITIEYFTPFRVGAGRVGQPIYGQSWIYAWRVSTVSNSVVTSFRTGQSAAGEPLRTWGDSTLECVLRAAAPAHTVLIFSYLPPV